VFGKAFVAKSVAPTVNRLLPELCLHATGRDLALTMRTVTWWTTGVPSPAPLDPWSISVVPDAPSLRLLGRILVAPEFHGCTIQLDDILRNCGNGRFIDSKPWFVDSVEPLDLVRIRAVLDETLGAEQVMPSVGCGYNSTSLVQTVLSIAHAPIATRFVCLSFAVARRTIRISAPFVVRFCSHVWISN
jgi:hypothetical protein